MGFSLGDIAGFVYDPLNVSGYGGVQGVNSDGRNLGDLGTDIRNGLTGQNATDRAIEAQRQATEQANGLLQPYSNAGMTGMTGLQSGNIMQNFTGDPGYQFRLAEGNKAINASAAARGLGNSGATLKALTRYGQDYASNEYDKAYGREFNRLSTLAGIGGNAAAGMANNIVGMGNANASANIAQANRTSNLYGQAIGGGIGAMFSDKRLKTEIKEISKEEIQDFRKNIKPYLFKYLSEEHGSGVWTGVMAQDLEKSKLGRTIVFENEKSELQIDIKKAVSLLLALEAEG